MTDVAQMMDSPMPGGSVSEQDAAFAQLIRGAQDGDARALEQLMILSQRRVAATAWRMLGNEEDARDAAQEVFLKAFKYLRGFDRERDFSTWLHRITVNVCRDMMRRRARRAEQFTGEAGRGAEQLLSPEDVEEGAIRAQEKALVARALSALTDRERAAVVLRDLEGLTAEEAARVLGSSAGTVRSQLSSARAKMKAYCEGFIRRKGRG